MQTSLLQRRAGCAASQHEASQKLVRSQACTPRLPRKLTKAPAWQQEFAAGATQAQPLVGVQYIHPEQEEGGAAQYHVVHPSRVDDATEQESRERRADMMNLLHKNSATETLIELRSARIAALAAVLISRGLTMPAATTIAAADASAVDRDLEAQAKSQAGKAAATQLSELCSYEGLLQRNQALMRKSRAQGMQIQAMESALQRAGVPLPPRTLDSSSLSSCASASFSSTGTFSDEEVPAAGPAARVGVVAAACVTAQPQRVRKHTVKCQFTVHCVTKPGDRVMIVGSHPALGSWDAEHGGALTLTWSKGHNWTGTISLEWQPGDYSPKMVSFKAVLQRADGSMVWQKKNHEVILGPLMGHHVSPAMATIEFDGPEEDDGLPLNYQDACTAYYNNHYDSEIPEAYARKKAAHEVQQSIKKLRQELASQSPSNSC